MERGREQPTTYRDYNPIYYLATNFHGHPRMKSITILVLSQSLRCWRVKTDAFLRPFSGRSGVSIGGGVFWWLGEKSMFPPKVVLVARLESISQTQTGALWEPEIKSNRLLFGWLHWILMRKNASKLSQTNAFQRIWCHHSILRLRRRGIKFIILCYNRFKEACPGHIFRFP